MFNLFCLLEDFGMPFDDNKVCFLTLNIPSTVKLRILHVAVTAYIWDIVW